MNHRTRERIAFTLLSRLRLLKCVQIYQMLTTYMYEIWLLWAYTNIKNENNNLLLYVYNASLFSDTSRVHPTHLLIRYTGLDVAIIALPPLWYTAGPVLCMPPSLLISQCSATWPRWDVLPHCSRQFHEFSAPLITFKERVLHAIHK